MNYRMIGRVIGQGLLIEAAAMVPALGIAIYEKDVSVVRAFACSILLILGAAAALLRLSRSARRGFRARDGLAAAALLWIVMSVLGCLPFLISRQIPSFVDALFEMVSGFTTTGASILTDVEAMSRGLLFWRSFSHWLGGMGVLVLLLALTSEGRKDTGFTLHILRAESPGPDVGKLVPHMRQTAAMLYLLYIGLTLVNILFLRLGRASWFDSLCISFGTAGTGGFAIKNDSLAGYSPYIQNVCTVFMILFGVNFSCYYFLCLRQFRRVFRDEELRLYLGIILGSIIIVALNILPLYPTFAETLRHAAFQVASIITTTGYATTDFDLWPVLAKAILLSLMVVGACGGSTGGGIKCSRILILAKALRRNLHRAMHPHRTEAIRMNRQVLDEQIVANVNNYLAAYTGIVAISFILLSVDNYSLTSNYAAVLSCFNNIGPGLEAVGPTTNYSVFSSGSKLVLIFDMLAGRLEIYPLLSLMGFLGSERR